MNVSLTPELEKMVHDKVEAGLYSSASEVVRDALRLQSTRDARLADLKAALAPALAQAARGERGPMDFEALKRKLIERHAPKQAEVG